MPHVKRWLFCKAHKDANFPLLIGDVIWFAKWRAALHDPDRGLHCQSLLRTGMAAITDKQMAQAEAQFKKFEAMINSMTPVSSHADIWWFDRSGGQRALQPTTTLYDRTETHAGSLTGCHICPAGSRDFRPYLT